jgi:hypothetical protein
MANLDITLKRKVGSTAGVYDVLYPTTIISQVEGLQTALNAKINTSAIGVANGVASLDANSKVPVAQLPDAVFDSLYFAGARSGTVALSDHVFDALYDTDKVLSYLGSTKRSILGYYWVSGQAVTITTNSTSAIYPTIAQVFGAAQRYESAESFGTQAPYYSSTVPNFSAPIGTVVHVVPGGAIYTQTTGPSGDTWMATGGSTAPGFSFVSGSNYYDTRTRKYYVWTYANGSDGQLNAVTVSGVYIQTNFAPSENSNLTPTQTNSVVEPGDWYVITKVTGLGTLASPYIVTFASVNNTYESATTATNGITRLTDATTMLNLVDGSNDVITENFLFDNKLADGSQLASGTNLGKIAPAAHHHDGSYLAIGGTAANATKLATARTIAASGDATWSVSFDGSANVTAGLTLANSGVSAGTFRSVTVDAKGRVTSGTNPTTLSGYGITDAQPLDADLTAIGGLTGTTGLLRKTAANTWSLDTTTFLTGNQTITVSGDATGSGATAIALTLANSGVTAGTYKSVTVDAKGRVTAGTNPTTLSGYGITDAYTQTQVDNLLLTRPEIYYNASANSDGDLVLDLDSDGAVA